MQIIKHTLQLLQSNLDIVIHPPINEKFRAFTNKLVKDSSSVCYMMNRAPYLTRNRNLVVESDILIALTQNPELEQLRSGTWSTVRYARKYRTTNYICLGQRF